jgi:LmbE family N-acetylglucosaminyl deacetylase
MLPELKALDRPPRLLGLFAHPDDEIFCGAGMFAELVAGGADIRIVSYTTGDAGQIRDARIATRATLGAVRRRELRAAAAELGVTDVVIHDRGDGTLAGQPDDELMAIAEHNISEHRPDVIVSFGPDGAYGHPDHIRVSEIATRAGAAAGVPVYHAAFPRQPKRLIDLLVDWLTGLDDWHRGTPEFAHGLMLFADGSSMLGFASDHMYIGFYPAGTFIVEQGERADKLFLILSGTVDVATEAEDGSLERLDSASAGTFFGERGLAGGGVREAHVIATSSVTCFVLSPGAPSNAAGRGSGSEVDGLVASEEDEPSTADFEFDVSRHAGAKLRALACHRSQYALNADMFPPSIIEALFGVERFNRA